MLYVLIRLVHLLKMVWTYTCTVSFLQITQITGKYIIMHSICLKLGPSEWESENENYFKAQLIMTTVARVNMRPANFSYNC